MRRCSVPSPRDKIGDYNRDKFEIFTFFPSLSRFLFLFLLICRFHATVSFALSVALSFCISDVNRIVFIRGTKNVSRASAGVKSSPCAISLCIFRTCRFSPRVVLIRVEVTQRKNFHLFRCETHKIFVLSFSFTSDCLSVCLFSIILG